MKNHWLRIDLCSVRSGEAQKVQHRIHPRDGGGGQEDDGGEVRGRGVKEHYYLLVD